MNSDLRAVVFDVGGVLVRTIDHSGRRGWEARLGLANGEAEAIVLNSPMGRRAQLGEIGDSELWEWVRLRLGLGNGLDEFRRDFWRGDAVDWSLIDLIRRLRLTYLTAIISNATDALNDTLSGMGIAGDFDVIVGSAYVGIMKPDQGIYRLALQRLNCSPTEAVFIDDMPENVEAARNLGMTGVLFRPDIKLAQELDRLGLTLTPSGN